MGHKRKQLWIDPHIQGAIVYRVISYWAACVITVELLNLTWQIATGPEQPRFVDYFFRQDWWSSCGRFALSALLLAPIMLDILRVSNRLAGPLYRMQLLLHSVATGGEVKPVQLRDGDFLHDFADDLNAALARLAKQSEGYTSSADEHQLLEELRSTEQLIRQGCTPRSDGQPRAAAEN